MRSMPTFSQGNRREQARRRRQRGAAMVEAAFMMPMFVILFFTSLYLHNVNSHQIALNIESRGEAWQYAMDNCGKGAGHMDTEVLGPPTSVVGTVTAVPLQSQNANDAGSAASTALGAGSISGAASSIMSEVVGFVSQIFPNPKGAQAKVTDSVSFRVPDLYKNGGADAGDGTTHLKQEVTVVCNEQAVNGNVCTALSGILGAFGLSISC